MAGYDKATLEAAEKAVLEVRDRPGRWAAEVKLLDRAIAAIRKLGEVTK